MSLPVVEQIAQVIADRLALVTVENGYYTDITEVYRPSRLPEWSPQPGTVVLILGDSERDDESSPQGNPPGVSWLQEYVVVGFIGAADTDDTPVDSLLSLAMSDLMKGICTVDSGLWMKMDGYALNAWWQSQERLDADGPLEAFRLTLMVHYRTDEDDPYTVR